tara:strand:+ start:4968 stop:5282 length:315 start_codon:yes stop_codon:yes gene_type:complete
MECKNCGHHIIAMFTEEGVKNHDKQLYRHYCYSNHSPTDCKQYPGHQDIVCCVVDCGCMEPVPKPKVKTEVLAYMGRIYANVTNQKPNEVNKNAINRKVTTRAI